MKNTDIAYAAGAIDADGCISIKRSTTRMRTSRDCRNPIYIPRVSLGQVTEVVPRLLKDWFGGLVYVAKPGTSNSRPMFKWHATDISAVEICRVLRPYLRIKGDRADALIELADLKATPGARTLAYWFAREHPGWAEGDLITTGEAASILGYTNATSVHQAIANGTLLALSNGRGGGKQRPRVPRLLAHRLAELKGFGTKFISPPEFVAAQHAIYEKVRSMNSLGIEGTCVNHRTGHHAPIG